MQSALYIPASAQSVNKGRERHILLHREVSNCQALAINHEPATVTFIPVLFFSRCPATIRRFVVTVRVNSIKRVVRGLLSHVREKVYEAFAPTPTNRNSASAVVSVVRRILAVATRQHMLPGKVLCALASFSRLTVFRDRLLKKAAARFDQAGAQVVGQFLAVRSAFAQNVPQSATASVVSSRPYDCQEAELFALRKLDSFSWHRNAIYAVRIQNANQMSTVPNVG